MLDVSELRVDYGEVTAVDGVSVTAAVGEVLAVLGPSGCGKSTLLRAIAGLEPLTSGTVRLGGRAVDALPPERRDVGVAFQEGALFPHRSVSENVAFGPRMRGWERATTRTRVAEVLDLVDLGGYGPRRVTELSGGEAQRVALARAIAARPRLLLLDEPLGALDRALRDRLLGDLPKVFSDAGSTVVYVTHDQDEALTLADRVAVMGAGRIRQVDTPDVLWRGPVDVEVARFLGLDQLVPGHRTTDGVTSGVTTAFGTWLLPDAGGPDTEAAGATVEVLLLPDALHLDGRGEVQVPGRVRLRRFAADHLVVEVDTDAGPTLRVPVRGRGPEVGTGVTVGVELGSVRILPG
jgi:thiamine transport system ATP-binding protein